MNIQNNPSATHAPKLFVFVAGCREADRCDVSLPAAAINLGPYGSAEAKDNLAAIVRACHSHEALVAALDAANIAMIQAQNGENPDFDHLISANEAALAQAKQADACNT